MSTTETAHRCALCGRKLKPGRWIVGKDRRITGKVPRYCWPGECRADRKRGR